MTNGFDKQEILNASIKSSGMGDVPIRVQRFPALADGHVHRLVTLISKETGQFYNMSFIKGIENTVSGHVADRLLDDFPDRFHVVKVDGKKVSMGKQFEYEDQLMDKFMERIKEDYELVPKDKKDVKRDRLDESKDTKNAYDASSNEKEKPKLKSAF